METKGFTEEEQEIMTKLCEVHALYIKLEKQHPSDISEWVGGIHILQKLLGMRILRREHTETFPLYLEHENRKD